MVSKKQIEEKLDSAVVAMVNRQNELVAYVDRLKNVVKSMQERLGEIRRVSEGLVTVNYELEKKVKAIERRIRK